MEYLHQLPYVEIEFKKDGTLSNDSDQQTLLSTLTEAGATDLLILAHGWNNDLTEARTLFKGWVDLLAPRLPTGRTFAVLGVFWPSKKFADEDLVVGGGASLNVNAGQVAAQKQLELLTDYFDDSTHQAILQQTINLVPTLQSNQSAPQQFLANIRSLLTTPADQPMSEPEDRALRSLDPAEGRKLLERISAKVLIKQPAGQGGAATIGHAVSLDSGSLWGDVVSGARMMANLLTYYTMKKMAGLVGVNGLNPLLRSVQQMASPPKLHLIGHSFGARLVTAATAQSVLPVQTLSLLQAAFSHYGFAQHYDGVLDGVFRPVLTGHNDTTFNLKAVALVTFSRQDRAVGIAYAVASRIAGQVAEAIGDKDDFYGGLGGNGAQLTPEANNAFRLGDPYQFQSGRLFNIDGNDYGDGRPFIAGHGDVVKPEIADAIVTAIKLT